MTDILDRYAETPRGRPLSDRVEQDFGEVVHQAPRDAMEDGIAEAFRSSETPPFEEMVARLFERSDPPTRAGLLDNLLAGLSPSGVGLAAGGRLGDVLRRYAAGARVAPDRAAQVDPVEVQEIARQARKLAPGVLERVSRFYARHPDLVRSLGSVAMGVALSRMAQRTRH